MRSSKKNMQESLTTEVRVAHRLACYSCSSADTHADPDKSLEAGFTVDEEVLVPFNGTFLKENDDGGTA